MFRPFWESFAGEDEMMSKPDYVTYSSRRRGTVQCALTVAAEAGAQITSFKNTAHAFMRRPEECAR